MRITTRILAAGGRSLTRVPMAHKSIHECLNDRGKLDRVKARRHDFCGNSKFACSPSKFDCPLFQNGCCKWEDSW